nr:5-formyltetrahydrofolate cyclo-ligase [Clostridium homopropionicum]
MQEKKRIRELINRKRISLKPEAKKVFDEIIFKKIIESAEYKNSRTILVYVSYNGEVDTHKFIQHALKDNKIVCVPKIVSKKEGMKAIEISDFEDLKIGSYGILEPTSFNKKIDEESINLVIVPGVAFDLKGGRIGYGGAFYDRFLKNISKDTFKVAIAYDFQILKNIPMEVHDEKIHRIITNVNTDNN